MCEADAYMVSNGQEDMIMPAVDLVKPEGEDQWHLVSIYGEQKTLRARLHSLPLGQHKLLFAPID
ncbi:MAG: CooT family nickel-binding protein [Desulfarculaceae bacterium]|nr:CooT family nickel-binding protein [Desulfarculaceae bacterium]